ncbi:MAG: hypothetical protein Q4F75_03555 [Pseudomonadota bacterium]|nr:hypothetical protein [Pseudomonadota bacterium]
MNNTSVNISSEINSRLMEIARNEGCSIEDCVAQALSEYIAAYDDCITDMNSVNNMERAFFLSAGE